MSLRFWWACALGLGIALTGCSGPDDEEDEAVGIATDELTAQILQVSPVNKIDAHTVSVATNDGAFAAYPNWKSDVLAAYELNGKSWWAYSNNEGATWTIPGQSWAMPSGVASDGQPFANYEGMPTAIGYHRNQTGNDMFARNFVYVTKLGSTVNSSLTGGKSTDVVALVSDDGGATFHHPYVLTLAPPAGYLRLEVSYVTAASITNVSGFDDNYIAVIWRETAISADNNNPATPTYTRWMRKDIAVAHVDFPGNDYFWDYFPRYELAGIPSTVEEISAVGGYGISASHEVCVAWGLPNTVSSCPATTTQNMEWRVNCQPENSTYVEVVGSDSSWRQCVGASSVAGGTAVNKNVSRPALALNPVTYKLYVAMAKKSSPADGYSRIQVKRKNALNQWVQEYASPTLSATGAPLNRDAWMPALAAYRYPTDPTGYLAVNFVTTAYDTVSNSRVRVVGAWWAEGGTPPSTPDAIDATAGLSTTYSVERTMGRYNSVVGMPHRVEGFIHGWGDQKSSPYTYAWTSRTTP